MSSFARFLLGRRAIFLVLVFGVTLASFGRC